MPLPYMLAAPPVPSLPTVAPRVSTETPRIALPPPAQSTVHPIRTGSSIPWASLEEYAHTIVSNLAMMPAAGNETCEHTRPTDVDELGWWEDDSAAAPSAPPRRGTQLPCSIDPEGS